MVSIENTRTAPNALDIPYVTADEAYALLHTEFERFMALLETLTEQDWSKPTACTAWSVRDIVAHQAGGYVSGTGYGEVFRQGRARPKNGQLLEDAINEFQLAERAGKTPAELVSELRRVGPVAVQKWAHQFRFARLFSLPHPVPGRLPLRHLLWVIHSRDTWMHRLDICRAANRHFEQTPEHDGRIAALVMLDTARLLSPKLDGRAIVFHLTGPAGGTWQVGAGEPAAQVEMDVLDFNIFASGRFTYDEALACAQISGDIPLVHSLLKQLLILY